MTALIAMPTAAQATDTPKARRQVVTRADQLPARNYTLDRLPSEYLNAPLGDLRPLAAKIEADVIADLRTYDIRDSAALRSLYNRLATIAQIRQDWAAVPGWTAKVRDLHEKTGLRLTSGLLTDLLARQKQDNHDTAWLSAQVRRRYGALPWADVQDTLKALKGRVETYNPELVLGSFRSELDAVAKKSNLSVTDRAAMTIVNARVGWEFFSAPIKAAIVEGLKALLDANSAVSASPDIWTPRTFALAPDANAQPVVIGIWDSGVDLALFNKAAPARRVAFDEDNQLAETLLSHWLTE